MEQKTSCESKHEKENLNLSISNRIEQKNMIPDGTYAVKRRGNRLTIDKVNTLNIIIKNGRVFPVIAFGDYSQFFLHDEKTFTSHDATFFNGKDCISYDVPNGRNPNGWCNRTTLMFFRETTEKNDKGETIHKGTYCLDVRSEYELYINRRSISFSIDKENKQTLLHCAPDYSGTYTFETYHDHRTINVMYDDAYENGMHIGSVAIKSSSGQLWLLSDDGSYPLTKV